MQLVHDLFPGSVVRAERRLLSFRKLAKAALPAGLDGEALATGVAGIDGVAPDPGYLGNIGRAALSSFYLDCPDADLCQPRQQLQRVQAGRLFDRIVILVIDIESSLAQSGVSGVLPI